MGARILVMGGLVTKHVMFDTKLGHVFFVTCPRLGATDGTGTNGSSILLVKVVLKYATCRIRKNRTKTNVKSDGHKVLNAISDVKSHHKEK